MVGRLNRIERRVSDSKQRLHSPKNAPVVSSAAGGVGWRGGSGAGKWVLGGLDAGGIGDAEVNVVLLKPLRVPRFRDSRAAPIVASLEVHAAEGGGGGGGGK